MKKTEKSKLLAEEVNRKLVEYTRRKRRDRLKAFSLKITATVCAALITVLLGLSIQTAWLQSITKDLALALGALISILNAWDAFYDHRALWIKRSTIAAKLQTLKLNLDYYLAGRDEAEIELSRLRRFEQRLTQVLEDDLSSWIQLRDQQSDKTSTKVLSKPDGIHSTEDPIADETKR